MVMETAKELVKEKISDYTGNLNKSVKDIIGATELWVYNSRTRKIGRYVADEYSKTLNVKGTTITGFQESISMQKTLRKPDIQIKDFMKLGKVQAKKFLDTVKTTETLMNGRINSDTLLLKATHNSGHRKRRCCAASYHSCQD